MKKFLIKIAGFAIFILAVAYVFQWLIDIRIKGRTVSGHDNLNTIVDQSNDMIFLGSSRCFVHFNPAIFKEKLGLNAMNIAVDGHSELTAHILRLRDYLSKNKPPHFVILSIDPLIQAGSEDSNTNFVHKNNFARYAYDCAAPERPFVKYFRFDLAERYIPLYALMRYKLLYDCITLKNVSNCVIYKYERHDGQWDTLSDPIDRKTFLRYYFDTTATSLGRIKEKLKEIQTICRDHNAVLICVQTPIYKVAYIKSYFAIPGRLCRELGIPFFDMNTDTADDDIHSFYNIDHLNTYGVTNMNNALLSNADFLKIINGSSRPN